MSTEILEFVLPRIEIDIETGCWNWKLSTTNGYAQGTIGSELDGSRRHLHSIHRELYEELFGVIPGDLQLDHLCRNRRCVLYRHLEVVTNKENVLRGNSPAAQHAKQTHCKNGHELKPENLYKETNYYGGKIRRCRICVRQRQNEARRKKRGLKS